MKYTGSKEDCKYLQEAVGIYFHSCKLEKVVPTISGLSLSLDFSSRKQLLEYEENENVSIEFRNTIKKAKTFIENEVERKCINDGKAGQIFWLKNHGWHDKIENDVNVKTFEHFKNEKDNYK